MIPAGDSLEELRGFLHENVRREFAEWFGVPDGPWVQRAVDNWFHDENNYDNRWRVIFARRPKVGRVLDMAAGCGTFMLYGLRQGYDVTGVEPEGWKREYFARKLKLSSLPMDHAHRMIGAFGESLPFADETFDLVTTFQTLEHVRDVEQWSRGTRACAETRRRAVLPSRRITTVSSSRTIACLFCRRCVVTGRRRICENSAGQLKGCIR